jgi:hypothetical protein
MTSEPKDNLIARLFTKRMRINDLGGVGWEGDPDCREAAEAIVRLRAENQELREALKPFVDAYREKADPGTSDLYNEQPVAWHVQLGAYRRALAALSNHRRGRQG